MVSLWLESTPWHYYGQHSPQQGAVKVTQRALRSVGVRALAVIHLTGNHFIASCTALGPSDGAQWVPSLEGPKPAKQVQCCSE